jgi:hypothetical protein
MQKGNQDPKKHEYFEIDDLSLQGAIEGGVMEDKIDIKIVTLWTVILTVIVVILCAIAFNLYKHYKFEREFQQAVNSEYRELNALKQNARTVLSTKDIADEESGFYQIPIDSAMTLIVRDYQND